MSADPKHGNIIRTDSAHAEPKSQVRVHIRWMIRRDMAEVLDIERSSFEFPWFEEDFIRCLRQRNCIGMVAEHGERVVGFMIYELHKTRLHILNFAVAADFRRRGIGQQMIEKLVGKLSSQRRTRITLEVRETNLPAQLFFKSAAFRAVTVLRAYYEDSPEDAYLMQFRHSPDEAETLPFNNRIDRLAG
jgi:ribosomal-protein-alanine N-acetyltransferase